MEYEKDTPGGELSLLGAYFLLKYPVVEMDAGAERELAVQVLAEWDSEGYRPVLAGALEKEKSQKVRTLLEAALQAPEADEYVVRTIGIDSRMVSLEIAVYDN